MILLAFISHVMFDALMLTFHKSHLRYSSIMKAQVDPQSRFIVEACWRMCNASVTHLSQVYGANATTLAESQSTLCSLLHAWTAMPFFMSYLCTAYLCSVTLFCRPGSTSFPNVHCLTVSTRNFVDNTLLSVS